MISRVIEKIKRVVAQYIESNKLNKVISSGLGMYSFVNADLDLYLTEKKVKLLPKKVSQQSSELDLISIDSKNIFWPRSVPDADLPWLFHEIFDEFETNPSSYNHPRLDIKNAKWVIDAGCCEGYFSIFTSELNSNCKIIAIEPLREMKNALAKTFESRISAGKFLLVSKALGKERSKINFVFNNLNMCDSSIHSDSDSDSDSDSYEVDVDTFDCLGEEFALQSGGLIKMDIEGAEMDALLGASVLMAKYKPKFAVAVYHDLENAKKCREIILNANPSYQVEFRGMYGYFDPPRPYMLFAW